MAGNGHDRAQELCESRGVRPGLPVLNMPYRFCGRKTPWKKKKGHDDPPTQIVDGYRSCTLQFLCIYVGLLCIESMQWKIPLYVYYEKLLWVVCCADQPNDTDTGSSGKNIMNGRTEEQANLMKKSRTDREREIQASLIKNHERTDRETNQLDEEITNGQRYKPI